MDLPVEMPPGAGAVDVQVVPSEVSTLPVVLGATNKGADVPLPKMTLFAVNVVAPVPPLPTGNVPVTLVVRFANVVEVVPVPPLAIGRVPVTSVVKDTGLLTILTKSEPFHATSARALAGTVTPVVGPAPRMTIEPVPELMTKYALLCAGAVMLRVVAPLLAVHKITAFRAWLAAPLVVLRVTSVSAESVVVPATAESSNCVIESLTVVPQVPDRSPVVGSARPRRGEKFVTAISISFTQPFRHFASSGCHCHLSLSSRSSLAFPPAPEPIHHSAPPCGW